MADQQQNFQEFIDMRLGDPDLEAWDGKSFRLDPGDYDFEVEEVNVGQSNSGNPALQLTFRVVSTGPMENRKIKRSYSLMQDNDGARSRMKNLITALGAPTDEHFRFSPASLVGCRMSAEVTIRTYETLDQRTGQTVEREGNDLVGERPYAGAQQNYAAPQQGYAPPQGQRPVGQQPVGQPVARRTGNNAQPRR